MVNHIFPKELLKTRDVENLLRAKPAAEIPYTEVDMIRAVNEGVPVVTSRPASPATLALASGRPGGDRGAESAPGVHSASRGLFRRADAGAGGGIRTPTPFGPPGLSRLRLPFRHSGRVTPVYVRGDR